MNKYLREAGGHFEAFCKASIAGCKTSEPAVANDIGCVDLEKLKKDPVSKKLLEEGWPCKIIHTRAEELYPGLADFIQRVCNATNKCASDTSELEVLMTIYEFAAGMQKSNTEIGTSAWMLQQVVTPLHALCPSANQILQAIFRW